MTWLGLGDTSDLPTWTLIPYGILMLLRKILGIVLIAFFLISTVIITAVIVAVKRK